MKKLLLAALILVACTGAAHSACDVTVDGKLICNFQIVDYDGIAAPAVSPAGSGRMYFDRVANELRCSFDGGAYAACSSGAASGVTRVGNCLSGDCFTDGGTGTEIEGSGLSLYSTDGIVTIGGTAGTNNENLKFDGETAANQIQVSSSTGANWYWKAMIPIHDDDTQIHFGTSSDLRMNWETTGNDNFQIGTDVGTVQATGYINIVEKADLGKANRSPSGTSADPVLRVYSSDATQAGDYIEMSHDQTNARIDTGNGGISMDGSTLFVDAANNRVGIGTTAPITVFHAVDSDAGTMTFPVMLNNAFNDTHTGVGFAFAPTVSPQVYKGAMGFARKTTFARGNMYFMVDSSADGNIVSLDDTKIMIEYTGNIGFGTTTPQSILDLSATDSALRVTRLADPSANISTPRNGMIAYDSTDDVFQVYAGGTWRTINTTP